jgi:FLVCR family feline leukemia virus subgroup C receptor-related protein
VLVGVVYGVCTLLAQLLEPFYGQSNENAYGFIGIVIILAGIPGALISGIVLDWAKQFHMVTRVLYVLAMLSMVLLCVVVEFGSLSLIYPAAAFFGATTSLISSGFELAAEITYPIPEATTAGLLNSSAQILGVIVITACGPLIKSCKSGAAQVLWMHVGFLGVGLVMVMIMGGELKRTAIERDSAAAVRAEDQKQLTA